MIVRLFIFSLVFYPACALAQYVPYSTVESSGVSQPYKPAQTYTPKDYNRPKPKSYSNDGAYGYNGKTGRVDRRYVPAVRNPNPPPNVYGDRNAQ